MKSKFNLILMLLLFSTTLIHAAGAGILKTVPERLAQKRNYRITKSPISLAR